MKDRATATLQTESSSEIQESVTSRILRWFHSRISGIFTGLGICIVLAAIGLLLGTVAAIIAAIVAWGTFLSFRKVAIANTLVWLLLINIALVIIGRAYDDLSWFEIGIIACLSPFIFFISWGAGIRLSTLKA